MSKLERTLQAEGYTVANIDYPSRRHSIEMLASEAVGRGLKQCRKAGATRIHFVAHSMGGILVRYFLSQNLVTELGRVVMLGPPNQGSEVADALSRLPGFRAIAGPAALQLGTGSLGIARSLGAVNYPVGVIAGSGSINPIFSAVLPGANDGMVSVGSTWVEGMTDTAVVGVSHTFVMRNAEVIRQTLEFIRSGQFGGVPY
jgi:triacylglycerol lipase